MNGSCYACEQPAVTEEHVPPLCLFPAQKDLPRGVSYRRNLIKVPSCVDHNLRKTKDDEYLMMILVAHYLNNDIATQQFKTKVLRAWLRRPHLAAMALQELRPAIIDGRETASFTVDLDRFNRSMDLIAKGLFFHSTKIVWSRSFQIWGTTLLPPSGSSVQLLLNVSQQLSSAAAHIFKNRPMLGDNQSVFRYQVHAPALGQTSTCVKMIFYDGIEVIAWSVPNAQP
jgi:hypothetical protein